MRLIIPSLNINIPVFFGKNGPERQEIIDAQNSAVYFKWGQLTVIADHSSQANFKNLNEVASENTIGYICGDTTKKYVCDKTEIGHILIGSGNRLYNSLWKPVYEVYNSGVCIYTCIKRRGSNIMDVRLTHWSETSDKPEQEKTQNNDDEGVVSV